MNTYYEVIATIEGNQEILYGSYQRSDCVYELEAERDSWKADGYRGIKIQSRDTTEEPDEEVYSESIVTKEELFIRHAPDFNFELDEDALLAEALDRGFVTPLKGAKYMINTSYNA